MKSNLIHFQYSFLTFSLQLDGYNRFYQLSIASQNPAFQVPSDRFKEKIEGLSIDDLLYQGHLSKIDSDGYFDSELIWGFYLCLNFLKGENLVFSPTESQTQYICPCVGLTRAHVLNRDLAVSWKDFWRDSLAGLFCDACQQDSCDVEANDNFQKNKQATEGIVALDMQEFFSEFSKYTSLPQHLLAKIQVKDIRLEHETLHLAIAPLDDHLTLEERNEITKKLPNQILNYGMQKKLILKIVLNWP